MMNPEPHHIEIQRTARYFTLGKLDQNSKDIWILLHGHRDLAGNFIMSFKELAEAGSWLVAPEGLMRFYMKGDYGSIGAGWMTKEDRENDIKDYVGYLDKLFEEIIQPPKQKFGLKVNALGFSQGGTTLSRWLGLGKSKVDQAVFWCTAFAHDVDFSKAENLRSTPVKMVFSDNDPYFPKDYHLSQEKLLNDAGISFESHQFSGRHEINSEALKKILL
jgi:predicted esterase